MKRFIVIFLLIASIFMITVSVHAGTITLIANNAEDSFILSGISADTNFGTGGTEGYPYHFSAAAVGRQNAYAGNGIGRQLYRFYTSTYLTTPERIISASLQLTTFDNYAGIPCDTAVYGLSDVWEEMSVTWNTQPTVDSSELDSVHITNPPWPFGTTFEWDVTNYVKSQALHGDSLISFQQRGQDEAVVGGVRWWQHEGEGQEINLSIGKQPSLIIVLDAPRIEGNIIRYIPEPATMLLLSLGLIGLAGVRRKFKK